ncbi:MULTISPECIES: glycosyltransferase family 2 protein [Actinoplanes]|uniref:glycosyltransferase family 2 protein n=1 Tax=Actinoplanes TaxID=1865 RepID=UPI0005F2EF3F|nr:MULTISPECIES: glycosyltransferase family 2 protein [Actinoplanes]GLY06353.1 glycosyl transferase family 2 [Actinoplanes sp. NBRC 101535]
MNPTPLATTIVIPTYSEVRWEYLTRTLSSARAQTYTPEEIIVVVDHNPAMFARIQRELPGVTVLQNEYAQGVSGNRNTGAFHAKTPLIAFLDDDIVAETDWLERQIEPFTDPTVVGTGGAIEPAWEGPAPKWMPDEFLWAVGGSYAGMPTETAPIRNVWSANMIVRRDVFVAAEGFRVGFGKLGDRNRPEDTDLCLRMSEVSGGHWMYVPAAVIQHEVPTERASFRFFVKRCYAEGRGKVQMSGLHENDALGAERSYLWSLPKAVLRHVGAGLTGKGADHFLRAGGVVAGVTAAGVGGVVETVSARRNRTDAGAGQ